MSPPSLLALLVCSACAYRPGSFRDRAADWPAVRMTTACLDLALERRDRSEVDGAVIAYYLGNRCDHRVVVDLASIRAIGRSSDKGETPLVAYDPHHELRPLALAALWSGSAEIAYQIGDRSVDTVCVDIGGIDRDAPRAASWQCFTTRAR